MNKYIQRILLAFVFLLTAGVAAMGQTDPGALRDVAFHANAGTFTTGKTLGAYSDENKTYTIKNVGVGEDQLLKTYVPTFATIPANSVFDKWYTTDTGTGGTVVTDATGLAAGTGVFNVYAIWKTIISISAQPAGGTVGYGTSKTLEVAASVEDAGTALTYQWYSNATASNTGGTPITDATGSKYITPATQTPGTHYYYCVVTATKGSEAPVTLATSVVTLTIEKPTLTAKDFTVELPGNLTYNDEAKPVTVDTKYTGLGTVTVEYKKQPDGLSGTDVPTDAGSYELIIKVAASANNDAATIVAGVMTIAKAPQPQPSGVTASNVTTAGANDGKITGLTTDMEYRASTETEYRPITGAEITGLPSGIYYVRLKGDDNHEHGTDLAITIAQGATPVYTVTFISDGTTKFAEQAVSSGSKATRPATDPQKANHTFDKWVKTAGGTDAFDFDSPITANVSVYASWTPSPAYDVTGTVTDSDATPQPLTGVDVVIHPLGISCKTAADGTFLLQGVPAGSYNLIATDASGSSVTLFITVTQNTSIDQPIRINGKANSNLIVQTGAPEVVVNKLDELAVVVQSGTDNVLIELIASPLTAVNAAGVDDIKAEMTAANMQISSILDLSLYKTVNDGAPSAITELTGGNTIDVIIPLPDSLRGRKDYALYRYHGSAVEKITTTVNAGGEKIVLAADGSNVTATLKKFSLYALGAVPEYTVSYMLDAITVFATRSVTSGAKAVAPVPAPVKDGYDLAGWYTGADLATEWKFATDVVTGNMSLFPKWTAKSKPDPDPKPDPTPDPTPDPPGPVGVEDTDADAVQVYGSDGAIVIDGATAGQYRVVSAAGSTVAAGTVSGERMRLAVSSGIYIVVLKDKICKVAVR